MNKAFTRSFVLGAIIIFVTNALYVLAEVPDDRWKIQIPVTSIFAIIYIVLLYFAAKKITLESKKQYLMVIFNAIVAFSFFVFAGDTLVSIPSWNLEAAFQDYNVLYIYKYIASAQYIIIYSAALLCYMVMAKTLQKK